MNPVSTAPRVSGRPSAAHRICEEPCFRLSAPISSNPRWTSLYTSSLTASGPRASPRLHLVIGLSPLRGSLRAALLCCDGFITLDFRTGQKYHCRLMRLLQTIHHKLFQGQEGIARTLLLAAFTNDRKKNCHCLFAGGLGAPTYVACPVKAHQLKYL